jgi:hypothetical protein
MGKKAPKVRYWPTTLGLDIPFFHREPSSCFYPISVALPNEWAISGGKGKAHSANSTGGIYNLQLLFHNSKHKKMVFNDLQESSLRTSCRQQR